MERLWDHVRMAYLLQLETVPVYYSVFNDMATASAAHEALPGENALSSLVKSDARRAEKGLNVYMKMKIDVLSMMLLPNLAEHKARCRTHRLS